VKPARRFSLHFAPGTAQPWTEPEQAAAGDYSKIQSTLSSLLSSPDIKAMLEQMGRQNNE
jgi:hypothetical protein